SRLSDVEVALTEKASLEDVDAVVSRVDELEGRVGDLESQVADLASQIAGIEKVEVTEEQIKAVISEKLEETIEKVTKEVVSELEGRVSDLESLAGDLDSRLSDVEVALTEKVSADDVTAMIEESLGDVVARVDDVEGRVSDLEGLAGDLDSRLSDVEVALTEKVSADDVTAMIEESLGDVVARVDDVEGRVSDLEVLLIDRPTVDEVTAMIEEKLAEIQIPDVEELRSMVEEHSDVIDALRADVDAILTEELPTMKDDIAFLQDQIAEISDRLSQLEAGVKPEIVEVPAEIEETLTSLEMRVSDVEGAISDIMAITDDLSSNLIEISEKVSTLEEKVEEVTPRLESVETAVDDLYAVTDDLALSLSDLSDKVSSLEETVAGVEAKVSDLEKRVGKFAVSGSTSVIVKKDFGITKNITFDDSTTLNLSFKPVDGVNVSTSIEVKGITYSISTSLNKLSISIAQTDFGLKNIALTYDHTADSNFAVDVYGLVGSKTAKFVASSDLLGVKVSTGVNGSFDGSGADLVAGKVSGSVSNVNYNLFGSIGRTATNVPYVTTIGADFDTSVATGVKLFGEAVYDGTFDVLGGVEATNLVPNLYTLAKATYQDNKLGLYAKASYPVSPQAKITGEVTVSDVTQTPGVTLKGSVEGTVAPFSYKTWLQAELTANKYSGYAEVSAVVDPYSFKVVADIPDLTKLIDPNSTKLTVEGSYKLTPSLKLSVLASTWDEETSMYTAIGKVSADLVLAPNVNVNLTVLKKALGTLTTEPTKDLSASLTTSVSF
ncbi:MAG: hypothetical protein ACPLKX_00375, partial [Dictyoglomaceae bacterium]